jgi:uncharacterized protein (DUF2342 family)
VSGPAPAAATGIVDWDLAQRIALALAGEGPTWQGSEEELRAESDRAAQLVRRYTGLKPKGSLPTAELVGRDEWARVNLEAFQGMSARVEEALGERMQTSERRGIS